MRAPAAILALLVALALASCGVPSGGDPQTIPHDSVPPGLLSTSTTSAAGTTGSETLAIYLVQSQRLVQRVNLVRAAPPPPVEKPADVALYKAVSALLQGPTSAELREGVTSAISPDTRLLSANVSGGIATIDLSSEFSQVSGGQEILAVAQLVFTGTEPGTGASSVVLELSGSPIQAPTGEGTLTSLPGTPLARSDFPAQAPS